MNVWKTRKKDKTFIRLGTFAETAYLTFFMLSWVSFWHCSIWKFVTVYYGNDVKEGFWLHLDMFVAKGNETVVSSCANCINQIIEKICIVPEFPEDCVCNIFAICYCKILSFFEMIKILGKCSNRCFIQYIHSNVCAILSCLIRIFLCFIFIDEYWKILRRTWKNIWSLQITLN